LSAKKRSPKTWKFVLYIAGGMAKSSSAISNLKQICNSYLGNDYAIEVIDLLEHPELARQHQILAVPTMIRTYPLPEKRVIGSSFPGPTHAPGSNDEPSQASGFYRIQ